ncbi:MAG: NUDIX hydrolase [Candidatus Nanohaloarchaea archaeon]
MSSFYSAVRVIVENQEGEILMVKEGKDHIHSLWDFPGGGWEDSESITECVKREVLEETGRNIELTGFLGVLKELNQQDGTETITFVFTAELKDQEKQEIHDKEEIIDTGFFKPEEIEDMELRIDNRTKILKKYRQQEPSDLKHLWNNLNLL